VCGYMLADVMCDAIIVERSKLEPEGKVRAICHLPFCHLSSPLPVSFVYRLVSFRPMHCPYT
jgi:hypothetical protein